MKKNKLFLLTIITLLLSGIYNVSAQKKARLGKVCGNPNLPCKYKANFQEFELPFDTGGRNVLIDSEFFYAIILKSVKISAEMDCAKLFAEEDRLKTQKLFPNNKVFTLKCSEPGENFYTNVAQDTSFMAIYAGKTLVEAKKFLKTVQAAGLFEGANLKRMQAGINGT